MLVQSVLETSGQKSNDGPFDGNVKQPESAQGSWDREP
jgi:hypothetical protein